jgi:hypothetical protein
MTTIAASKIATIGATIGTTLPGGAAPLITDTDHPDLVGMWTMDNVSGPTYFDESVSAIDLIATDVTVTTGIIGNAIKGNGSTGKLSSSTPADFSKLFTTTGALSFWFKLPATGFNTVLSFTRPGSNSGTFEIDVSGALGGNKINIVFSDVTIRNFFIDFDISLNVFHHVVAQSDGVTVTGYVDSVQKTITELNSLSNDGRWIGTHTLRSQWGAFDFLAITNLTPFFGDAEADQTRFFNRPLTQGEINSLYNGGAGA